MFKQNQSHDAKPDSTGGRSRARKFFLWVGLPVAVFCLVGFVSWKVLTAHQSIADLLGDATPSGDGVAQVYQFEGNTLITLKPEAFGHLFHWYAEAVELPPQVVSQGGNAIGETVMRLERRGDKVYLRDLAAGLDKRAVDSDPAAPQDKGTASAPKLRPIDLSLAEAGLGAIVLGLDILAEDDDGTILLNLTPAFSTDLGGSLSVLKYLAKSGLVFAVADPSRSYVESAKSFDSSVTIRSHLTFLNAVGEYASIIVGHSLSVLPLDAMPVRYFDDRVGYFKTSFTEYGGPEVVKDRALILRHRLERPADASDGLTDPVTPIVYYIGRDVPDRWRPYLKTAVESWQPAFEAAGFSNAIIARDAPSAEDDPAWSPENTNINVIRWIAQPFSNAMGPVTYDPRTGEILGAHILLWPQVMDLFSSYYFALHSSVDPEAASFPLSDEKMGQLLTYVLAHEVGHTLGLRHNHLASTAYTTTELRNAEFANVYGPNASIMAYGRFNQAAQPGDGVTQFLPVIGPYDRFAIKWGYSPLASQSKDQQTDILDAWAHEAARDRMRRWSAGEMPEEFRAVFDPRVQTENTGSDRVQATRLGIRRLSATIAALPDSAGQDREHTRKIFAQALGIHAGYLKSVTSLIGGVMENPDVIPRYVFTAKDDQQEAVMYLLGEGSESLEIYARDSLLRDIEPAGGLRLIDANREQIMQGLMGGTRLALLEMQARIDPDAYGIPAFGTDILQALFGALDSPSRGQQTLQIAFLDNSERILKSPPSRNGLLGLAAAQLGLGNPNLLQVKVATGAGTAFPGWARQAFPPFAKRLEEAADMAGDEVVTLHYQSLAARMREIAHCAKGRCARIGAQR